MKISRFNLMRWIAIVLIVSAAILLVVQLIQFSRLRAGFPSGTLIAGIAVGGMDQQQAADRVNQAYNSNIELVYNDQRIQVKPSQVGFEMDIESMIAAADQQRVQLPFWSSFWDYLWNRQPASADTPLVAAIDENRLRLFLMNEIASRYDQPAESSIPIAGSINFQYGKAGKVLDVEKSLQIVERAMQSAYERSAQLVVAEVTPSRPSLQNLKILIEQVLDQSKFDGLTEVYVLDLEKREEINFAYELGNEYEPGIAFSAWSTIKIPIMIDIFKRLDEPTPQYASTLLEQMIEQSEDTPADTLLQTYVDQNLGPYMMTDDMRELGLKNTFMGAYFYLGAPPLRSDQTPANQRLDYDTDPDRLNQTTTTELGMLLDDIYQCAKTGGGTFAAVFPGEITQSECQMMITYLTKNRIGQALDSTLPEEVQFAHKHGWVTETEDGLLHTMLDAGIAFSQGGDYVIVVAMYQPTQLIWDISNPLFGKISRATYNYFNITQ